MMDALKIIIAFVVGYFAFVALFYYVAKWMFPKIELDEEYERFVETYHRSRERASRIASMSMMKPRRQLHRQLQKS